MRRLVVVIPLVVGVAISAIPAATGLADNQAQRTWHPLHSLAPHPDFLAPCVLEGPNTRACISASVAAIENGRRVEHMRNPTLALPRNFATLSAAEQTFVIINLERVDRGIRPFAGMVGELNRTAAASAAAEVDPHPAQGLLLGLGVNRFKSLWADDYGALGSDYEWMYDDGYAGPRTTNVGCRYRGAPGCWAHRAGVLAPFVGLPELLAGVGSAPAGAGARSVAAILTGGRGGPPRFTYSWRQALRRGADSHRALEPTSAS